MGILRKCVSLLLFFLACFGNPQTLAQNSELTERIDLQRMLRPAGYVFAGRVRAIEYLPAKLSNEVATVRITFIVEQAVRGTTAGTNLTVREWAGLWNSGERYRVGERLMLFFYPPSRLGLTSLVGGARGRFVVDRGGRVILPPRMAPDIRPAAERNLEPRNRIPLREFTRAIRQLQNAEK
jgi:hypothetical protein